jgi:hypothetical protein
MYRISRFGQSTRGGPLTLGLEGGLTTSNHKNQQVTKFYVVFRTWTDSFG